MRCDRLMFTADLKSIILYILCICSVESAHMHRNAYLFLIADAIRIKSLCVRQNILTSAKVIDHKMKTQARLLNQDEHHRNVCWLFVIFQREEK